MTAVMYIGDAIEVMSKLPEKSVDLVLTSPPFLALRSYLPADHPDKALEGGSQATPGAFVDWLIDVVEACDRVLAPHGSLCIELGDSFSGSGGAGGDYSDNGWRAGQPKFGGSATGSRESAWSVAQATWFAGVIDTEGYIGIRRQESERQSPSFSVQVRITMMDRQVCDRAAEIAGVGNVTQDKRGAYSWTTVGQQARYVLTNIWPHLLIKQRQAMAAIELQRNIEEKKRRGNYERIEQEDIDYRQMIREYVAGLNGRGENRGVYVPTWEPPVPPMLHPPASGPLDGWPMAKSLALIPELFRFTLVYGTNPLTGRQTERWRLRNVVRWVRPNPPVGALGDKFRPATSELMVFCKSAKRYFDLDAVRDGNYKPRELKVDMTRVDTRDRARKEVGLSSGKLPSDNNPGGAPPLDWWEGDALSGVDGMFTETEPGSSRPPDVLGNVSEGSTPGSVAPRNIPLLDGEEETRYGPKLPKPDPGIRRRSVHLVSNPSRGDFGDLNERIMHSNPAGAPPLDWWNIPPGGYEGAHYAVFPPELCVKPVKAMCPERVCNALICVHCDRPHGTIHATTIGQFAACPEETPLEGSVQEELRHLWGVLRGQERMDVLPEVPVGAQAGDIRTPRPQVGSDRGVGSDLPQGLHQDSQKGSSPSGEGLRPGAPVGDGGTLGPLPGAVGTRPPQERNKGRQSSGESRDRVERGAPRQGDLPSLRDGLLHSLTCPHCGESGFRVCGEPSRRIVGEATYPGSVKDGARPDGVFMRGGKSVAGLTNGSNAGLTRVAPTLGWSDCSHDDWRPGLVLDPFGGTGTTALVATGHGRDAILIDLDERNFDLALERVGPFILERAV